MTIEAESVQSSKLVVPAPAKVVQAAEPRTITLEELWEQYAQRSSLDQEKLIKSNLIEELRLNVNPTIAEIYARWNAEYRSHFNAQLLRGADPKQSILTHEQRRITDLAFGLPDCKSPDPSPADSDVARAYLASALELCAYYQREDDEDEGPLWCKHKNCAA